ncbi:hypothetical protein [Lysinibacillus xylanilyticus]|uniref:Uncharacterized protein n=1 Tax=Lysinibacillus xylanilyticus TaxID=582475 RepID=A0A2M9QAM9_9BACI|nr:hypothetical protein [Lysinibacillus xylanilyticus]PJO45133.1 hypothetical protein CWD94_03655 [Lysinibacillus xylanilyticus]
MEVIDSRLKRNISVINKKLLEFNNVQRGKLNGEQLNLSKRDDLTYQIAVELITWITNTDELLKINFDSYRVEKSKNKKTKGEILGIRHAFNLFKHDMAILSLEEKKYSPHVKTEAIDCVWINTVWLDIKDIHFEAKYKSARTAYVRNLQGKTLYETFNSVVDFLNRQYGKVITKK